MFFSKELKPFRYGLRLTYRPTFYIGKKLDKNRQAVRHTLSIC